MARVLPGYFRMAVRANKVLIERPYNLSGSGASNPHFFLPPPVYRPTGSSCLQQKYSLSPSLRHSTRLLPCLGRRTLRSPPHRRLLPPSAGRLLGRREHLSCRRSTFNLRTFHSRSIPSPFSEDHNSASTSAILPLLGLNRIVRL